MAFILSNPTVKSVILKFRQSCDLIGFKSLCENRSDGILLLVLISSMVVAFFAIIIGSFMTSSPQKNVKRESLTKEETQKTMRDFTVKQLREFDGSEGKPIYIGLKGSVYDVSAAASMYGPEGSYHCFAGRDASRAMAKLSFEESELSNSNIDDLNAFEKDQLDSWVEKYKYYKQYPIVGQISIPPAERNFKREELLAFKGNQEIPKERIHAPIYVGVNGKVFDVSYGGKEMYGAEGPYHVFAGIDASRALGKMSLDPSDLASHDITDFTEEQLKTLNDWTDRLDRKYPTVGTIVE